MENDATINYAGVSKDEKTCADPHSTDELKGSLVIQVWYLPSRHLQRRLVDKNVGAMVVLNYICRSRLQIPTSHKL